MFRMDLLDYPVNAYNYVHFHYGTVGVIVACIIVLMSVITVFFWLDRRR